MSFFKRNSKQDNASLEKDKEMEDQNHCTAEPKKVKKRMKIGFGPKHKKELSTTPLKTNEEQQQIVTETRTHEEPIPEEISQPATKNNLQVDMFVEELTTNEMKGQETKKKEEEWGTSKRKAFSQRDMKGKPVFLEDTGEKLGVVFDSLFDGEKNLIGYKIKDSKSDSVLSFPLDQFDEDKNGLIFVPSWYTKGVKTIEQLEFKDRITPELMWLIADNTISTEELLNIFIKHDDKIANYIQEAIALKEILTSRLHILEKERKTLKESLMDLTEKRLIKDIDRREFSDLVMEHRRKVNVLDINIKKCRDLLDRLQRTSFGLLGKTMDSLTDNEVRNQPMFDSPSEQDSKKKQDSKVEELYREKYLNLKDRYDTLQEGYNDLKIAVEKLLNKDEV